MKIDWSILWVFLGVFVIFWPWGFGAIDLLGVFFVDHQVTSINWTEGKTGFAVVYPWLIGLLLGGVFLG